MCMYVYIDVSILTFVFTYNSIQIPTNVYINIGGRFIDHCSGPSSSVWSQGYAHAPFPTTGNYMYIYVYIHRHIDI
jgi:hypothetical protein